MAKVPVKAVETYEKYSYHLFKAPAVSCGVRIKLVSVRDIALYRVSCCNEYQPCHLNAGSLYLIVEVLEYLVKFSRLLIYHYLSYIFRDVFGELKVLHLKGSYELYAGLIFFLTLEQMKYREHGFSRMIPDALCRAYLEQIAEMHYCLKVVGCPSCKREIHKQVYV